MNHFAVVNRSLARQNLAATARYEPVNPQLLHSVNRLSDLLFVLGRWVAKRTGEQEYLWERGLRAHASPPSRGAAAGAAPKRGPTKVVRAAKRAAR